MRYRLRDDKVTNTCPPEIADIARRIAEAL